MTGSLRSQSYECLGCSVQSCQQLFNLGQFFSLGQECELKLVHKTHRGEGNHLPKLAVIFRVVIED